MRTITNVDKLLNFYGFLNLDTSIKQEITNFLNNSKSLDTLKLELFNENNIHIKTIIEEYREKAKIYSIRLTFKYIYDNGFGDDNDEYIYDFNDVDGFNNLFSELEKKVNDFIKNDDKIVVGNEIYRPRYYDVYLKHYTSKITYFLLDK